MGSEGPAIQEALAQKLGRSRVTVPQVCVHTQVQPSNCNAGRHS